MVHAIERGVNIDWIKTGQGNMMAAHEVVNHIKESQAPYNGAAFVPPSKATSKPFTTRFRHANNLPSPKPSWPSASATPSNLSKS
jgi:hypothetical protein